MANLEVIALDTATPQLKAPQAGDGYAMPRPVTVTEVVGSSALTLTGATQTTAVPVLNATQTWNNAATTFTGMKLNVTDTASNAASLLADFQVGGSSRVSIRKDGLLSVPFMLLTSGTGVGLNFNSSGVRFSSASDLSWTAGGSTAAADLSVFRDAADTLAQRRGTNAQTLRVYNTYTDASNYERGKITWASNVLQIGTEKAGTGTARNLELQTDGTTRLTISTSGTVSLTGTLVLPTTGSLNFTSRGVFSASADGVFRFGNNANTDFGRLQLGGTTSAFPAIKRSGTAVQVRLADDTAYASLEASTVSTATAYTVATLPAAGTAGRRAYVTDATAPTFLGALTGGGAVVCPVFDNGTAWVAG